MQSAQRHAAACAALSCLVGVFVCTDRAAADASDDVSGELVVVLEQALTHSLGGRPAAGVPLTLHLERTGGQWTDTWAEASSYNVMLHEVSVVRCEILPATIRLQVDVKVVPDFWVEGGSATYEVELARRPSRGRHVSRHEPLRTQVAREILVGKHRGTFRRGRGSSPREGRAEGIVVPPRQPPEGFVELACGEHPRLLFRKAELPRLREKLKTPLGRAVLARLAASDHEVALALMYSLAEDRQAGGSVHKRLMTGAQGESGPGTIGHGGCQEEHDHVFKCGHMASLAVVYDLVYDLLSPSDRKKVREWLARNVDWNVNKPWSFSNKGAGANPLSGYASAIQGCGGLMALALWKDSGPPPEKPMGASAGRSVWAKYDRWRPEGSSESLKQDWEAEHALWQSLGGMDLDTYRNHRRARRRVYINVSHQVGEGGSRFGAVLYEYAIAHRNVFGVGITGRADLPYASVPLMLTAPQGPNIDRRTHRPRLGSAYGHHCGGFVHTQFSLALHAFARLLPLAADEVRPALVRFWLQQIGLKPEQLLTDEGAKEFVERSDLGDDPWALCYVLRHFPLRPGPAQPGQALPRAWEDITRGRYYFRSGRGETDDILAVLLGSGAAEAGHFGIRGLGHLWTDSGGEATTSVKASGFRLRHNAVMIPEVWLNEHAPAVVTHMQLDERAGSGSVSLDLSDVYKARRTTETHRKVEQRDRDILITRTLTDVRVTPEDIGVRALRSFAVDYSGQSGVPGLFALVDRLSGDHKKTWALNVPGLVAPPRAKDWTPTTKIDVDGNTFTLRRGDASLKATFVSPPNVRIQRVVNKAVTNWVGQLARGRKMIPYRVFRTGIEAAGPKGTEGEFFVVMTLHRGDGPEVSFDRPGLNARVSVGGQALCFDGERIVVGE